MMIKSAFIYVKKFLYKLGNEFTAITGGWATTAWSGGSTWIAQAPTLTKESGDLKADLPGTYSTGKSGVIGISSLINLTDYTTLRVKLSYSFGGIDTPGAGRYQRLYLVVSDVTSGYWTSVPTVGDALILCLEHGTANAITATDVVYSLDITALNGNYRIYLGFAWAYQNAASWVKVTEVELVK